MCVCMVDDRGDKMEDERRLSSDDEESSGSAGNEDIADIDSGDYLRECVIDHVRECLVKTEIGDDESHPAANVAYDLVDATISDESDTVLYRVGEGRIMSDVMNASLRVEQRRDMGNEVFPSAGGVRMEGGDVCVRKVVLEPFSHFMELGEGEKRGLMDRACKYYPRFLNRMSGKVGCRVYMVPRCVIYVVVSTARRWGTEYEWIPQVDVGGDTRCRVVLDTSRDLRDYVRRYVPYIHGLDMVSGMTMYASMIARTCAEMFDWKEMVGEWVGGGG